MNPVRNYKFRRGNYKNVMGAKKYKISNGVNYQNLKFKKRWQKLSFFEQMANIGSEVQRAINWREKNPDYSKLAFERALELIDLTITDKKNQRRGRLRELLRTRELLIDYFCFDNIYKSSDKIWQNYFFAFNYAANR